MRRHLDGNVGSALTVDVGGSECVYLEVKKGVGRDNAEMAIWTRDDGYTDDREKRGVHF